MADDLHAVVQRMIDAGESEANIASVIKASQPSFIPSDRSEWLERLKAAAVDVPVGMAKNAGRMIQAIPVPSRFGMTNAAQMADAAYGLSKGASEAAMQPSNATQEAGGYVADAAALAAGAGEIGTAGKVWNRAEGWIENPAVRERVTATAKNAVGFAKDTASALKTELASGPLTPEKTAGLIVKYGKTAVKSAIVGAGGYGAWSAIKHLF